MYIKTEINVGRKWMRVIFVHKEFIWSVQWSECNKKWMVYCSAVGIATIIDVLRNMLCCEQLCWRWTAVQKLWLCWLFIPSAALRMKVSLLRCLWLCKTVFILKEKGTESSYFVIWIYQETAGLTITGFLLKLWKQTYYIDFISEVHICFLEEYCIDV